MQLQKNFRFSSVIVRQSALNALHVAAVKAIEVSSPLGLIQHLAQQGHAALGIFQQLNPQIDLHHRNMRRAEHLLQHCSAFTAARQLRQDHQVRFQCDHLFGIHVIDAIQTQNGNVLHLRKLPGKNLPGLGIILFQILWPASDMLQRIAGRQQRDAVEHPAFTQHNTLRMVGYLYFAAGDVGQRAGGCASAGQYHAQH